MNDATAEVTWDEVLPLLERWQIALVPHPDRSWDVLAFGVPFVPPQDVRGVAFAGLPQAIKDLAARCAEHCSMENG
jgi:hypothetical protein